jgi:hypothetical protein
MPVPSLPLPPEELARRLSRGLGARPDGLELSVAEPVLVEVAGDPGVELRVRVTATSRDTSSDGERWRVSIPVDPADLAPTVSLPAVILILRANLEEWWDVKDSEPEFAAWGRRLD